jgi:xanthine dehydrogenase accessory factor
MSEAAVAPKANHKPHVELDVLKSARSWLGEDGVVALATVIETWGSAPVPIGGQMAIAKDGRFQGSVSGGCIENDIIVEAEEVLGGDGKPKTLSFGVADETAWRAGLPCGGQIKVLIERFGKDGEGLIDRSIAARETRRGLVIRTDVKTGLHQAFERGDDNPPEVGDRFRSGESKLIETPEGNVFLQALVPPARVIIVGATHLAQLLAEQVKLVGYELILVDPRTAYASDTRFADTRMITEWPQDALPAIGLDPYTAVVALAHVAHLDDEALKVALKNECLYVGALGSTRNHAKRTERLKEAGFTDADIARIKAPIGIDIGAQTPAEIAVSIMADIVRALRGTKGEKKSAGRGA